MHLDAIVRCMLFKAESDQTIIWKYACARRSLNTKALMERIPRVPERKGKQRCLWLTGLI